MLSACVRRHAGEALVVAEIEIGLGAVVGDEDFAVLIRAHRARIDVEIGIELAEADPVSARLQQRAESGGGDALPKGRDHAAGNEHVARHNFPSQPGRILAAEPGLDATDVLLVRAGAFAPYGFHSAASSHRFGRGVGSVRSDAMAQLSRKPPEVFGNCSATAGAGAGAWQWRRGASLAWLRRRRVAGVRCAALGPGLVVAAARGRGWRRRAWRWRGRWRGARGAARDRRPARALLAAGDRRRGREPGPGQAECEARLGRLRRAALGRIGSGGSAGAGAERGVAGATIGAARHDIVEHGAAAEAAERRRNGQRQRGHQEEARQRPMSCAPARQLRRGRSSASRRRRRPCQARRPRSAASRTRPIRQTQTSK